LRAIVLAAVHEMARTQEHTGGGDAQGWTNELSATCQDGAWVIVIMVAVIRWCRGHSERASAERELAGTMAIRQDGIVTNAMEAISAAREGGSAGRIPTILTQLCLDPALRRLVAACR